MMNYFYLCTFFKQLLAMQDEGTLDLSSLKAFQNKSSGWMLLYA